MNRYRKIAVLLSLVVGLLALSSTPIKAEVVIPTFPTCSNPQGTLKVSYETGIHGIIGSSLQYSGSDEIYTVSDITLIQCFCAADGNGIQTNWWKINSLAQDEINSLKKLGWFFVPDGSVWGLDSVAYLAKNSNYACGLIPTPTTTTSTTDNGGGDNGSDNGSGGGEVLGAATSTDPQAGSVLGLAATGNSLLILSLLISGLVLIFLGKRLRQDTS